MAMNRSALISATLGLSSPWKILTISFRDTERRIDISVGFDLCTPFVCPACGKTATVCRTETERWFYPDFFSYDAFFSVKIPSVFCPGGCGDHKVGGPWPKENTKFVFLSGRQQMG